MSDRCPLCQQQLSDDTPINFDDATGLIVIGRKVVELTQHEAAVFQVLWESRPRVVSLDRFLSQIYGLSDCEPDGKIIDVYVCKMRRKLKGSGIEIVTVWGRGYRMLVPAQTGEA